MNDTNKEKLDTLTRTLRKTGGLAVAFSGGVDSTLLAALAYRELGDKALAITAASPLLPEHEQLEAQNLARDIGIRHEVVKSKELDLPGFADNTPDRCYLCKNELFALVHRVAKAYGIKKIADGTNADDCNDFRPGAKAAAEHGVLSPLREAGLTKKDIRRYSRQMGLPTADKAAFACLASRFPYGTRITPENLKAVEAVERSLRLQGFHQFRARHHGNLVRIELEPGDVRRAIDEPVRSSIKAAAQTAGYAYVTIDLEGYRTGSMNEILPHKDTSES